MSDSCPGCGAMPRKMRHREFCPHENAAVYDREVLATVLVYHYRKDIGSCGCGWAELGASHPEHVADVYEASVAGTAPRG